jgi:hypothetical protein
MAGQVLGGGETGPGDHVAQDGPAEIVPGGGREAGLIHALLQNAMQRFRGQILVQPSQVPPVGNEAEKRPGRLAPDCQPIPEIVGGIAYQLGRDRALLITFPDYADEVPGSCDLRGGDILHEYSGSQTERFPAPVLRENSSSASSPHSSSSGDSVRSCPGDLR